MATRIWPTHTGWLEDQLNVVDKSPVEMFIELTILMDWF
jgi:hypothetical protein